jgi:Zn-dependent protease with chaperone function
MRDDHIGVSEPRSGRAIAGYFDGHIAQSHQVMLAVTHDMLQIRSTDGVIATAWPLARIAVTARADDAVSLGCRREIGRLMVPGTTFSQLLEPHLRSGSGLRRWGVIAIGFLILLLVALLVEMLPNLMLPAVPASWDYRLGRVTEATLLAQHPRCTGETGQQALNAFVDRLMPNRVLRTGRLIVSDNPVINAFALPRGDVILLRGLIRSARSGNELAGVIAHELGHVVHRDSDRRWLRQLGLGAITAVFGWNQLGGEAARSLVAISYGRAAETAADDFAISTLRAAGLRADGLGSFLARSSVDRGIFAFLSDHPSAADRVARTREPAKGQPAFTALEWLAIRDMCGPTNLTMRTEPGYGAG